jgi:hypothetical protein
LPKQTSKSPAHLKGGSLVQIARWVYFDACIHHSERRFCPAESADKSRTVLLGSSTVHDDIIALFPEGSGESRQFVFSAEASSSMKGREQWSAQIGYNNPVPGAGLRSEWFLSCFLPYKVFRELDEDVLAGRAKFILAAFESDMMVVPEDGRASLATSVKWYLQPRANLPAQTGSGRLTLFRWSLVPDLAKPESPYRRGTQS